MTNIKTNEILWKELLNKKIIICFFTGFTSGLPLFILISLLPAWLSDSGFKKFLNNLKQENING